jgi:predicted enzyme related to lactoylglutathione lyase
VAAKKSAKRKTARSKAKTAARRTTSRAKAASARKSTARSKAGKTKKSKPKQAARPPVKKKTASRPASKKTAPKAPVKKPVEKAAPPRVEAPPPVPNAMGLLASHSDYTTHNFEEVRRFYTQQLGFSRFQYDPNFRYLWVQTSHQSSVGFMPPITGPELPLPPREPTMYFLVRDIEEAFRKLQARGVSFEAPPETMPWGHRIVRTRDPEGRSIVMAQDLNRKDGE